MLSPAEVLPSHLESLVPAQWAIWRWFVLRGAGFAAGLLDALARPDCAAAADELVLAEAAQEERFQEIIQSFNAAMDDLTEEGKNREDAQFKAVLRARRRLADRKVPEPSGLPPDLAAELSAITQAQRECERARKQWESRFSQCLASQNDALRAIACDARFQEAVIW